MKKIYTIICLTFLTLMAISQEKSISGFVYDKQSGDPLAAANVVVKETQKGTVTADNGFFEIMLAKEGAVVLQVSYVGYKTIDINAKAGDKNVIINIEPTAIMGNEAVISASRVSENIKTAPLTIQKINIRQIESASSGDYFQSLGNLRDVEIINNSIGFKIFNTRGFNSTAQLRVVQLIDGVDNQLPTINIVPGNMFGVSDIDIRNIEVISGPASAIYGPNAMQGVISFETKDPFNFPGIAVKIKGGNREFMEGQFRAAKTFLKNKLGIKIVGSYMKANDWQSDYIYGNQGANPMIQMNIMGQMMQDPSYESFANYFTNVDPNAAPFTKVMMPGYSEKDLFNGKVDNMKISGSLYYKFSKDMEAKYVYRYSSGTSLFMGNNRAPLEGFYQQLHLLEFTGKGFTFHAYRSNDNTMNTHTLVGAGVNLGYASLDSVDAAFLPAYVNEIQGLSNNFTTTLTPDQISQAIAAGSGAAQNSWLEPGTEAFNTIYDEIKNATPPSGAHYQSETSLYHIDGMYEYTYKKIDFNIGASFRNTKPVSHGTVFADTLQQDGEYRQIDVSEFGGFLQSIGHFSDDKTKLYASVRVDKNENYDLQFSPRIALVTAVGNNNFRITMQSAFRAPTVSDQFQLLNRGRDIVVGNIDGFSNCYSQSSINSFYANGNDASFLVSTNIADVKPEQVKSIEFGYNGTFFEKLYVDFSAYFSRYSDFIAYQSVGRPGTGVAGEQSGVDAMNTSSYQKYSVATNTDQDVDTYGFSVGTEYYFNNKINAFINYTFCNIDSADIDVDIIPGFNSPKNKVNIGIKGNKIFKNLGFVVNWKWVDDYYWQAVFASGPVPSYNTLDLQFNYAFPKIHSKLRIGGSNILGNEYIQAYAMPLIGVFWYASWSFDFDFKK